MASSEGRGLRFGRWVALEDADAGVPAGPGVFQVRASKLRTYPTGKSAMVHYGATDDLHAAAAALAGAHPGKGLLFRYAADLGRRTPAEALDRLLTRFCDRFGSEPSGLD